MRDLTDPRIIWLKGWLFGLGAMLAGGLLLWESWSIRTAALLAICVWCSCRFYYFAFCVVERYVDSTYQFRGMGSFVKYLLNGNCRDIRSSQAIEASRCHVNTTDDDAPTRMS